MSMFAIGCVLLGCWQRRRRDAGMHAAADCHHPRERELRDVVNVADQPGVGGLEQAQAARILRDEDALHVADAAAAPHRPADRLAERPVGAGPLLAREPAQVMLDQEEPTIRLTAHWVPSPAAPVRDIFSGTVMSSVALIRPSAVRQNPDLAT